MKTLLEIELSQIIAYEIGKRNEEFDLNIIWDTLNILFTRFSNKDLKEMLKKENKSEFVGIHEAVHLILEDTYKNQHLLLDLK